MTSTRFNPEDGASSPDDWMSPLHSAQQPDQTATQQPPTLLLDHFNGLGPTANEIDTLPLPNVATMIRNFLTKETSEIRESAETLVQKVGGLQALKKSFRDFYVNQATHVFEFLDRPLMEAPTISQAYTVVKRFGRHDYNANRVKIKDLMLDLSCNSALDTIQATLDLSGWVGQTRELLHQWRTAIAELGLAEKSLQCHLTIFSDTWKTATTLLNMPSNDNYENLVNATETYLKTVFQEHGIEQSYRDYLKALKKMALLNDGIHTLRFFVNTTTEPLCSVCLSDPVALASVPCGHTFCQTCGMRQTMTCYICRATVKDKIKVYFS